MLKTAEKIESDSRKDFKLAREGNELEKRKVPRYLDQPGSSPA